MGCRQMRPGRRAGAGKDGLERCAKERDCEPLASRQASVLASNTSLAVCLGPSLDVCGGWVLGGRAWTLGDW